MGFFKKFVQKANELNEKLNSGGGLEDKVKELQETIIGKRIDALGAGLFSNSLGALGKDNSESSDESLIFNDTDSDSLEDVEDNEVCNIFENKTEDSVISEHYKRWFKETYGISYEEHMASLMENADKPLSKETMDFIRNFGKD